MTASISTYEMLNAANGWQSDPVSARPIEPQDQELLFRIYASTRQEEMRLVPWSDAEKEAFLRSQAFAQHTHYQNYFPDAEYLVLEQNSAPIGRLYVHITSKSLHIIDIALLPEHRNRGIGSAILTSLIHRANQGRLDITLYVEYNNPAQRLYARHQFEKVEDAGINHLLARRFQN